jgi:hypothetical protein
MRLATILNLVLATGVTLAASSSLETAPDLDTRDSPNSGTIIARAGDDYPYKNSCNTKHDVDPWRFYKCECTSFVAWRINDVKKIKFTNWYKGAWPKGTPQSRGLGGLDSGSVLGSQRQSEQYGLSTETAS